MLDYSKKGIDRRRLLGRLGLLGIGLATGFGNGAGLGRALAKADTNTKVPVTPPPADVNDLSMEVAALRTMYLLKASPDQAGELQDRNQFNGLGIWANFEAKPTAQPPRKRTEAKVSKDYLRVLADLRAAFIVNNEARIHELSDQMEDLIKDDAPDLDDSIEITDQARKNTHRLLLYFDANRTVPYLAAYGKEFPDPFTLLMKTVGAWAPKPKPEDWADVRAFAIQEVGWQVGGLNLEKQTKIREQVATFLDKANTRTQEELKKGGLPGAPLKTEVGKIVNAADCADVIRNVLEQDLAELLSNPRMLAARTARRQALAVIGRWSNNNDAGAVWSPK